MGFKGFVARQLARVRSKQLLSEAARAVEVQEALFQQLIAEGRKTAFGRDFGFGAIRTIADFQRQVPVMDYEAARQYFERVYQGEADVLWPGKPLYLAKTSGTTSGTKAIPLTAASLHKQIGAARDGLLFFVLDSGISDFFDGKMIFLSGSPEIEINNYGVKVGRLSGIVNHFVPKYLQGNRLPTYETNCIEDWETKVKKIVEEAKGEDLRLISGIPPWVQMFFEELYRQTGKMPLEVWPNLRVYVWGGVDFQPYAPIFEQYLGKQVHTWETFPASEGFFSIQHSLKADGTLLLPNNGVFFEFIPLSEYGKPDARRLTLRDVQVGEQYALILTTNAGLWAYDIGDTVKFTSLAPYPIIRVTGRVKHFISAFGEHVIAEEVNAAMLEALATAGGEVQDFTVAPYVVETRGESCHEWLVEFTRMPENMELFTETLDQAMQRKNVYYSDLRTGNILRRTLVTPIPVGGSREYMRSQGKLGGQNKFPRLSNNRAIADWLREFAGQ